MITHLTSELNRINQGCGNNWNNMGLDCICIKRLLCPTCQKEKETLKKVSLMWADALLSEFTEEWKIKELQQIKSLMEKA
jgi:hypothetical protein